MNFQNWELWAGLTRLTEQCRFYIYIHCGKPQGVMWRGWNSYDLVGDMLMQDYCYFRASILHVACRTITLRTLGLV